MYRPCAGFGPDRNMRCNLPPDHLAEHRCCAIGRIAHKAVRFEIPTPFDPVHHRPDRFNLLRTVRWCGIDIHDDPCVQVNQIVGRVGKKRRPTWSGGPSRSWIGQGNLLWWCWRLFWFGRLGGRRMRSLQRLQIFADCAALTLRVSPIDGFSTWNTTGRTRVSLDDACINRESFTRYESLGHAATQHCLEHMAQHITIAKAYATVLGKC